MEIVRVQIPASCLNPERFSAGDLGKFLRLSTFQLLIRGCACACVCVCALSLKSACGEITVATIS